MNYSKSKELVPGSTVTGRSVQIAVRLSSPPLLDAPGYCRDLVQEPARGLVGLCCTAVAITLQHWYVTAMMEYITEIAFGMFR